MKALVFSAAAALATAIPTAAHSTSFTLGGPLAVHCYNAALERDTSRFAREACDRSLAEEPLTTSDRAATLVNRGILYMLDGQYGVADHDFDTAIATDQQAADAWLNKAFLRLRQRNGAQALPLIDRAMELRARREALVYLARGLAHEQVGDYRAAYADLSRAQTLEPEWEAPAKELARYSRR